MTNLDTDFVRGFFPAIAAGNDHVFVENAGGTYVPRQVIARIGEYMTDSQVQPNWNFPSSQRATERIKSGKRAMAEFVNAEADEIVIGPSTTLNIYLLADAIRPWFRPGDEIIVTEQDHEANIGAWRRWAESGVQVKEWRVDRESGALAEADLFALLTPRTKLVAFTHCSNVIGIVHDLAKLIPAIHKAGALAIVDGTAYAPHFSIDVKALDVDFYVFSLYKTCGPHQSLLYGKRDLLRRTSGRNHFFIAPENTAYHLLPGGPNHEFSAGLVGLAEYFLALDVHHFPHPANAFHDSVTRVYGLIAEHEARLAAKLVANLRARPGLRLYGQKRTGDGRLAPVIAFTIAGRRSSEIAAELNRRNIAIGHGDFWARRCIEALGLDPEEGVLRIGLAHYNDDGDIDRLIGALDEILG